MRGEVSRSAEPRSLAPVRPSASRQGRPTSLASRDGIPRVIVLVAVNHVLVLVVVDRAAFPFARSFQRCAREERLDRAGRIVEGGYAISP